MPPALPLERELREELVFNLAESSAGQDPLSYLQNTVFENNSEHVTRIPIAQGRSLASYYQDVVRYCEMSAWSEEPPLIISLLKAFEPLRAYPAKVKAILTEGPFRCHPSRYPYYVCRVTADMPLLNRMATRTAAAYFGNGNKLNGKVGQRVLRVDGPDNSGKKYTLKFFEYLAAIQPLQTGVLHFDFGEGDGDVSTLAENEGIPVELYIARRLEEQARRHRQRLSTWQDSLPALAGPPGLPPLGLPTPGAAGGAQKPYAFRPLSDMQQRTRWAGELAREFVSQVLSRIEGTPPQWWVVVFSRCEKIPHQAEEFVRRLIERAAGADSDTAVEADRGPLRVVLLGNSDAVMPYPIYQDHVVEDDLGQQKLNMVELVYYFYNFCLSRGLRFNADDARHYERLKQLARKSYRRAGEIMRTESPKPPWPRALARAVMEETLPLETLAAQKRSDTQPQGGGGG
jgi:hypothetical protein